ncbi:MULTISPECIES: glycosyltransferase family 4 protein [Bacteria]|uniref:glycosyltransferase family 4 protein n=1 Tax=Bacteria TaxID=2 RepID=UPI003C7A3AB2
MDDDSAHEARDGSGAVHILLPAVSPVPIGGYKVAYEYANALAAQGVAVTVWHSEAFMAQRNGSFHAWPAMRSVLAWWLRGQRAGWRRTGVRWFRLDTKVRVRAVGGLPPLRLRRGDAVLATAVQTMPFAGRVARRAGARSAALIQHDESWADTPEAIAAAWRAVDERIVIAPWLAERSTELGLSSRLLPNAIVAADFPKGPALADRPEQVTSLLSPHGYKRPDVVIGVLEEVLRRRPSTTARVFGPSRERPSMASAIDYVADPTPAQLRDLYQTSRVYLCGSDAEGWHLPPAEATLSGAAVVSTDIGGVRASMADDALYAPPGQVTALADQVIAALDDVSAAQERADRARARLLETTYEGNTRELRRILLSRS